MDPLIVALQDAARWGFSVHIHHIYGEFLVAIGRNRIMAGDATDRVQPFTIQRPDLTDALGNALAIVGVEIGIDRAAKERKLAE